MVGSSALAGAPGTSPHLPRVLVVNVEQLFGEILRLTLTETSLLDVLPSAPLDRAVELACRQRPDVVVLSLGSDHHTGMAVLRQLRELAPRTRVLVLAARTDPTTLSAVMTAGASGCLDLETDADDFVHAVQSVARGEVALSGLRLAALVGHLSGQERSSDRPAAPQLTQRESDVLRLLAQGATSASITATLGISLHTTRTHIQNVLAKLGVHSRLEAAAYAADNELD